MSKKIDISVIILSLFLLLSLLKVLAYSSAPVKVKERNIPVEIVPTPTPIPDPRIDEAMIRQHQADALSKMIRENTTITFTYPKFTSLGYYFITSYCPAECGGSWQTASGVTCHRSEDEERYTAPTTCAVDPRLHNIGEDGDLFFVPEFDRVFIAEDTGSGVKNKHLDLFYIDYSDVLSFPTGYYEVYSVEYVTETVILKYYNPQEYTIDYIINNLD
jgi:3D (Asp-Asp-Asp) domain-containing protein